MNFHAILHAPDDILNFGVPTNVNTRSDEMHHKKDKKSAKRTQKRPKTFDIQSLQRIEDHRVIEFGMEELAGRRCWDYYQGIGLPTISQNNEQHVDKQPKLSDQYPKLSGVKAHFYYGEEKDMWMYDLETEMKAKKKYKYTPQLVGSIGDVLAECDDYFATATIYSEYWESQGQFYCAAPQFGTNLCLMGYDTAG